MSSVGGLFWDDENSLQLMLWNVNILRKASKESANLVCQYWWKHEKKIQNWSLLSAWPIYLSLTVNSIFPSSHLISRMMNYREFIWFNDVSIMIFFFRPNLSLSPSYSSFVFIKPTRKPHKKKNWKMIFPWWLGSTRKSCLFHRKKKKKKKATEIIVTY